MVFIINSRGIRRVLKKLSLDLEESWHPQLKGKGDDKCKNEENLTIYF